MRRIQQVLILKNKQWNCRSIATILGVSQHFVKKIMRKADEHNVTLDMIKNCSITEIKELFYPKKKRKSNYEQPNFDYLDFKYKNNNKNKNRITLKQMHEYYCRECLQKRVIPYSLRSFYKLYQLFILKKIDSLFI
jgi:hypothetical protein